MAVGDARGWCEFFSLSLTPLWYEVSDALMCRYIRQVDATKMLLSRHGGRNTLPGRCVPTPIAGGGTLQRPRIRHQQTNHEQQTQQQTPQSQMQQQAAIERQQQDMRQQHQAAILRQEEEKKKQAAIPRQHTQDKPKPAVMPQQEKKKHQVAAQKYRFAPPLFQHTFERK